MEWVIGQSVVVVEPGHREARVSEALVAKVGRKWVTVKIGDWREMRFDSEGRGESDYGHAARLYPDRATHEASVARDRAWNDFRAAISRTYGAPEHLSAEDIIAMTAALSPATAALEQGQ